MGLNYYQLAKPIFDSLATLIEIHENDVLSPRARGYWFDRPESYDYARARDTARQLDETGRINAIEHLELSEVQAHGLTLINLELPNDGREFPPALFLTSVDPATLRRYMKAAKHYLGADPEEAAQYFTQSEHDPRFAAYLNKQIRHLNEALPLVWRFHERAAQAGNAILVVDLRARDLEVPEEIELIDAY